MKINKNLISINHTALKRSKNDIQWIVVHYVGALGDAKANTDYYKSTQVGASADFWVGFAGDVWQGNDYYNYYSWHCGGGYQSTWTQNDGGKYYGQCTNKNSIGIEMCVRKKSTKTMNATDTDWYFEQATIESTAELVATLMKELSIDINHVIMHYHVNRKICAAPFVHDYNAWINFKSKVLAYFGEFPNVTQPMYRVRKSWDDEKSQIFAGTLEGAKAIVDSNFGYYVYDEQGNVKYGVTDTNSSPAPTTILKPPYKVRKSLNDANSQIGSYSILENAKVAANTKPGFCVYDSNGIEVYRSPMSEIQKKNREILDQMPDYKGLPDSKDDYVLKVAEICMKLYPYTKILPSVVVGQTIIENGFGQASDALVLTKNNNLVGIKSSLLTESWREYSVWDGRSIKKNTPEVYNGVATRIDDYFRVYSNYAESLLDYEMFLTWAKEGGQYKYRAVVGMTDPKEMITYIHNKGYATSLTYTDSIMRIINQYNLTKYDREVGVNNSMAKEVQYYRVATDFKSSKYVGQIGAYTNKDNAIEAAKKAGLGYKVYSPDGQVIYTAQLKDKTAKPKKIYAVRRTLKDVDSQIGLFSSLDNAKKLADNTWGFNVYNIETNKPVYKPVLMNWQKMCASAIKLGEEMLKDLNEGHQWEYDASGEKTFAKARKKDNYKVNCSGGVYWIMCDTGIFPDRSVLNWYGCKGGIRWLNNHAEADFKKYFDVIYVGNKTVVQCIKDGTLHPGDIITYMNISHTNMYLGNIGGVETSFDSGHNNCIGSGNGAKFKRWVGPLTCGSQKIAYIMRVKENASSSSTQYRVQAGSYLIHDNANAMLAKVKRKGFDAKIVVVDGEYVVQLGLFGVKSNADALAKKVTDAGITSIVVKL